MLALFALMTFAVGLGLYALAAVLHERYDDRKYARQQECLCFVGGSNPYCPECYSVELSELMS